MRKKIIASLIILTILPLNILTTSTYANVSSTTIKINVSKENITRGDAFNFFADYYNGEVPESYKYINIGFRDVEKGSKLEDSIKKLVYLNLIENPNRNLEADGELSAWGFFRLSEKVLGIKIIDKETEKELKTRKANDLDLSVVKDFISDKTINLETVGSTKEVKQKKAILNDVYKTILNGYYNKNSLDEINILDEAIQGIAKGTNDKHTVYFPPVKSQDFHDMLSGEYEGIGSYVEMEKPGVLKITSPIPGSPSEKAGLKGGDIVTKVDGKKITEENSIKEVVSWIKGPAGTHVTLTIDRNGKTLEIDVTRAKIVITDIESEMLNSTTYYIQIKSFGDNVSSDFREAIEPLTKNNNVTKVILDLRNNGGGYLAEVTEILSYFVPKGEKTAVVKYTDSKKDFISRGYKEVDFSKYKLVVLQNSGTASASEILIGTLEDYYEDLVSIGEKSYGKGSVQVMKNYADGSMLKYTIAKWFTGGTETGIDGIGLEPSIELELNYDLYQKHDIDNQLEKAKKVR